MDTSARPPAAAGIMAVAVSPISYESLFREKASILMPLGSVLLERPRHSGQSI